MARDAWAQLRHSIRLFLAMSAALLLSSGGLAGQTITANVIRPGVHLLQGPPNGNLLAVDTDSGWILVDAQSAERAAAADSVLSTIRPAPVRYVLFTHYHEDHTGGMGHWRGRGAQAVAHHAVPGQMLKDTVIADMGDWHRTAAPPEALPDHTFRDSLTIRSAGVVVRLFHLASAHTDGDAVVWLPDANVLHVGDLIEPEGALFIDWWAGGRLGGMIAAAQWVLDHSDEQTAIVPGHGRPIARATVAYHRDMLVDLGDEIRGSIEAGEARDALLARRPEAAYAAFLGGERRAASVIRLLHYGLTRFEQ